jgi:hypothetical protein
MTVKKYNLEHNVMTGEQITREFTAEEYAHAEALAQEVAAEEVKRVAAAEALATLKASAKAKLVAGTKLTAEEAEVLVV